MWLNPLNKLNPNCIYCYQLKTACKSQTDVVSVLYFQHTQPNGCRKGVPGHAWMHRLHALAMEELPRGMAWAIHWALP